MGHPALFQLSRTLSLYTDTTSFSHTKCEHPNASPLTDKKFHPIISILHIPQNYLSGSLFIAGS